jgi:hypothetical protein
VAVAAGSGRLSCAGRCGYVWPPGGWTGRAGVGVDQGGEDVQPCGRDVPGWVSGGKSGRVADRAAYRVQGGDE